jgi:hypothetical protein
VRKRNFRTFTRNLQQLRACLKNCKVTEIAIALDMERIRSISRVLNGHKTDPKDAQWIAELLETGKLKGSMPNRNIKVRP